MIDIEFSHVYTDEGITRGVRRSWEIVKMMKHEHTLLSVMVDDYSHNEDVAFDYDHLYGELYRTGLMPNLMIKESDLVWYNMWTLDRLPDTKLKRGLVDYIRKNDKHPCSLFTATWYLLRLGEMQFDFTRTKAMHHFSWVPSNKLVNVLPADSMPSEKKARSILKALGIKQDRIVNIYYD